MDISERIAQIREEKKIRKADMSRILDMDASQYNKFEKRGKKLTIEQLDLISQALGVSMVELLTGESQKVEDSGKVKELGKRIDELEEMLQLHREDKIRLKHYFLNVLREAVRSIITRELVWNNIPLEDEKKRLLIERMVEKAILTQKNTNKFITQVSPLAACLYYFLIENTTDDKNEAESERFMAYTGELQTTGEAILEYLRIVKIPIEEYEEESDIVKEAYNALERLVSQLTPEQENLLKLKRKLLKDIDKTYEIAAEVTIKSEGWKDALIYALQSATIVSSPLIDGERLVVREIMKSGIIDPEDLIEYFAK